MEEFKIPLYPECLFRENSDGYYYITREPEEIWSLPKTEMIETLESARDQLELNSSDFVEHELFDFTFALVCKFTALSRNCRPCLISVLLDGLNGLVSSINSLALEMVAQDVDDEDLAMTTKRYCNAAKMYMYCIQQMVSATEKLYNTPGVSKELLADCELPYEKIFGTMVAVLEADIQKLWKMAIPDEEFMGLFGKICSVVMENAGYFRSGKNKHLKSYIAKVFGCLSQKFGQAPTVATRLMHLLCNYEHIWPLLNTMVEVFTTEYRAECLLVELLREIGQMGVTQSSSADKKLQDAAFRNVSNFLVEISQQCPNLVAPYLTVLLPGIENDSYTVRNAVIQVIGNLLMQENLCKAAFEDENNFEALQLELIETLLLRLHDVSAYSRSKALQTIGSLITSKAIPASLYMKVTEKVGGRLRDRTANVRKNAVQVMASLLQYNSFGASLIRDEYVARVTELGGSIDGPIADETVASSEKTLKKSKKTAKREDGEEDNVEEDGEGVGEEEEEEEEALKEETEETKDQEGEEEDENEAASSKGGKSQEDPCKQEIMVAKTAIQFIDLVDSYFPGLFDLLSSKNTSDILETIEFFVVGSSFGLPRSHEAIKRCLLLIWSKEPAVKQAVSAAFQKLYLTPPDSIEKASGMAQALFYAKSVIHVLDGVSLAESLAMEELLEEVMKSKDMALFIAVLFDIFVGRVPGATWKDRQSALHIISMTCLANRKLLLDHLDVLLRVGLRVHDRDAMHMPRYCLLTIQKLMKATNEGEAGKEKVPHRLPSSHVVFRAITTFMLRCDLPEELWYSAAETAINTFYTLSESPDQYAALLIRAYAANVFPQFTNHSNTDSPTSSQEEEGAKTEEKDESEEDRSDSLQGKLKSGNKTSALSKLLFLAGHVSLRQLVHLEDIHNEIRRRRDALTKYKEENTLSKKNNAGDDELEMASSATSDEADDDLKEKLTQDLIRTGLLGIFAPVIVNIVKNINDYQSSTLRASALLALCKYMCVSSKFCGEHLHLLFVALSKQEDSVLRGNIVIAVGDLAFRFPNLLAPWTSRLFKSLEDEDHRVRKNSLMVLTHLILNDMVKVKGHISNIALCMEDKDPKISDLSHLFFRELAQKGNTVYNVLPDMISNLTNTNVPETVFQKIMRLLFSFVQNERQKESLVDKLCHRFPAAKEAHEYRNLAYCLSLLDFSDRTMKKLIDLFHLYKDKLTDQVVNSYFQKIITKTKKGAKAETRATIDSFEETVENGGERVVKDDDGEMKIDEDEEEKTLPAKGKKKTVNKRKSTRVSSISNYNLLSSTSLLGERINLQSVC